MLLRTTLLAGFTTIVASAYGGAQQPVTGVFLTTLGSDTVAVEHYTRTGTKLEGRIVTRYPRVLVAQYVIDIDRNSFRGMSLTSRALGEEQQAPPILSVVTLLGDTSATIQVERGGRPDTVASGFRLLRGRIAPLIPGLPPSFALYEQILAFNAPRPGDSARVSLIGSAAGQPSTVHVIRRPRDSVIFASSIAPTWIEVATVDRSGRILTVNATATTLGTTTRRAIEGTDVDSIARQWAAVEAVRGRAGRLSPADTLRASVGAANIEIVYSRPAKRGREIWGPGRVVPPGRVWRAGANAATQLTTSADLQFGNVVVPAGRYTLWMLPGQNEAKLIINTQTGQWGTEYNQGRDLGRVDMTQALPTRPVESFTISIVPQGTTGLLRFSWDDREYTASFRVR